MWASGEFKPTNDTTQNINSTYVQNFNGTISFTTTRKMDTGDSSQDFVFPFGQPVTMCYAASLGSDLVFHYLYGFFALEFDYPIVQSVKNAKGKNVLVQSQSKITSINTKVTVNDTSKQFYKHHGMWLWVCWMIFGYVQVFAKRYL